jgi:hypothetical protein
MKEKYANDPVNREKTKKRASERYYRLKAEKEGVPYVYKEPTIKRKTKYSIKTPEEDVNIN